jgi:uroporphyrinogen-III decarboxylase
VGKWQADPVFLRQKYNRRMRMMGGVDKHIIPQGEPAIRAHLERLKGIVAEGGYIPLPDHRIPPDCSLEQFRVYIRVFNEVFNNTSAFGS